MRLRMKQILLLSLVSTQILHAQQEMNLKDCITYSLSNHGSVKIYENQVDMTQERFTQGLSSYLPQINGTVTFDDNLKRQTTIIPAGALGPNPVAVQFGNQYTTNATVQADQVIYNQSLITSLQSFKEAKQLVKLQKEDNDIDVAYNTAAAYYQALIYKEQVRLLAENEKRFNDLLQIQELQFQKGVIQKIDVDRVKINLSNISSQKKMAESNLELMMNQLKTVMGMDISASLQIADSIQGNQQVGYEQRGMFNLKSIKDYQIQEKNVLVQKFDFKSKKMAFIPTLSFYARYGAQSFGNDFAESFKTWYDYAGLGLKLNISVFDGLQKYSLARQSKLNMLNEQENLKLLSNNLELQYKNALTNLENSYQTLQTTSENVILAKDVLNTTELQYKKGVATLSDLLNADYAYKEAESNYMNSLLRYMISRLDLEKSKGTLIDNIDKL